MYLDYVGVVGLMMEKCLNVMLYVYFCGVCYMIDLIKFILGVKVVYKEDFDKFFDLIFLIEEECVYIV